MKFAAFRFLALLAAFAAFLTGCQTAPKGPPQASPAHDGLRVTMVPPMDHKVIAGQVVTGYTDGNLLTVDVTLSKPDRMPPSLRAEYKFEWFSDRGRIVPSPLSRYTQITLRHGQPLTVSGIAPTPKVSDFNLIIRPLL